MRQAMIHVAAAILAAVGCQEQQQQTQHTMKSTDWPGWTGTATIDPAGDVQKLQGKWSRIPQGEGAAKWSEAYLVFDGDTATFESPNLGGEGKSREPGEKPYVDKYQFVLNSSIEPKVMRYIQRLGEGKPIGGHQAPHSHWYKLDGDTLTTWDHLLGDGRPKVSYRRVKRGD